MPPLPPANTLEDSPEAWSAGWRAWLAIPYEDQDSPEAQAYGQALARSPHLDLGVLRGFLFASDFYQALGENPMMPFWWNANADDCSYVFKEWFGISNVWLSSRLLERLDIDKAGVSRSLLAWLDGSSLPAMHEDAKSAAQTFRDRLLDGRKIAGYDTHKFVSGLDAGLAQSGPIAVSLARRATAARELSDLLGQRHPREPFDFLFGESTR